MIKLTCNGQECVEWHDLFDYFACLYIPLHMLLFVYNNMYMGQSNTMDVFKIYLDPSKNKSPENNVTDRK